MSAVEEADRARDQKRKEVFRKAVVDAAVASSAPISSTTSAAAARSPVVIKGGSSRKPSIQDLSVNSPAQGDSGSVHSRRSARNHSSRAAHGVWSSARSPINHLPQDAEIRGIPRSVYPTLPRAIPDAFLDQFKDDEKMLMGRFKSGQNFISAMNAPDTSSTIYSGLKSMFDGTYDTPQEVLKPGPAPYRVALKRVQDYLTQNGSQLVRWGARNDAMFDITAPNKPRSNKGSDRVKTKEMIAEEIARCFAVVPKTYFSHEFRVSDPAFFQEIAEMKSTVVLQEKLSQYLDLVEVRNITECSLLNFFTTGYHFESHFTINRLVFHGDVHHPGLLCEDWVHDNVDKQAAQVSEGSSSRNSFYCTALLYAIQFLMTCFQPLLLAKGKRKHANLLKVKHYLELVTTAQK
jgi:hypothetical protein